MNQELKDKAAKILCEIIDDNAPIGWERYRGIALVIASSHELMELLNNIRNQVK